MGLIKDSNDKATGNYGIRIAVISLLLAAAMTTSGTSSAQPYTISGTVTLVGGMASVTEVTLYLSGDASGYISPNPDGTYSFTTLLEGVYAVTPSLANYIFQPLARSYDPLSAHQTHQDFVGTYVAPGVVPTATVYGLLAVTAVVGVVGLKLLRGRNEGHLRT